MWENVFIKKIKNFIFRESLKGLNDLAANIDGLIDENIDSIRNSLKDPADLKDKKFALTRHVSFINKRKSQE